MPYPSVAITVIGHGPEYKLLGSALGANFLDIEIEEWERLSHIDRWARNRAFLDEACSRNDVFLLATPFSMVRRSSFFERELHYLASKGYRPRAIGTYWILERSV